MHTTTISIKYYAAGQCSHNLAHLFKGFPKQTYYFPAGCWLIHHPVLGYFLYDTGYSYDITKFSVKNVLYQQVTPVDMAQSDTISKQLSEDGIEPHMIKWVILSHLHPDHIGDAKAFTNAQFIVTPKVYATLKHPRLMDLVFKDFLPADILERCVIINDLDTEEAFPYAHATKLLKQQDILAVSCDGHAAGQLCLYFPTERLFIASDISWGQPFVQATQQMKYLPRFIMSDFKAYREAIQLVQTLQAKQIEVVFSHDRKEIMNQRFNTLSR